MAQRSVVESEEVFLAGQRVAPGRYRDLETGRVVELQREEALPASLDGRVASYRRALPTWAQIARQLEGWQREATGATR